MKTEMLFIAGFIFFFCFVPAGASQVTESHLSIPFETIDIGEISYYHYDSDGFTGADLIIKNRKFWVIFWSLHTAGIQPRPPLPDIDFRKEIVIVTVLGWQSSGGGPGIEVLKVNYYETCRCLHVLIEDNTNPGPLDVITNPFHIIKLKRSYEPSVVFEHWAATE